MTHISHTSSILKSKAFPFTSGTREDLALMDVEKANHIQGIDFAFDSSDEHRRFFVDMIAQLATDYDIYFYYLEKTATEPSAIRSKKKLLYPHRLQLGLTNLYQEEVVLPSLKTLLYSIIKLDVTNTDYVLSMLVNSLFSFAYLRKKSDSVEFGFERITLTEAIKAHQKPVGRIFELSPIILMNQLLDDHSAMIRIVKDGSDKTHLTFYYTSEIHAVRIRHTYEAYSHTGVI